MHHRRRHAFTLIELLVVVAAIAILAGLILAVIHLLRTHAMIARTRAIMGGVRLGITMTGVISDINASVVEHPLANTTPPRSPFTRAVTVAGRFAAGAPVAMEGEALRVADPSAAATVAASEAGRLMLPSDRYLGAPTAMGTDCPLLYGVERAHLTVLGAAPGLHAVRRLPGLGPTDDLDRDGVLDGPPYTTPAYSNLDQAVGSLANPDELEQAQRKLIGTVLAPTLSEITSQGGIRGADATSGAAVGSTLILGSRLRSWGGGAPTWTPSAARDDSLVFDGTSWVRYRLRGTAVYDAWGHELLCWIAGNNQLVVESAGPDGVFRWDPGPDGIYQTAPEASAPAGDDRDGERDNLRTGIP